MKVNAYCGHYVGAPRWHGTEAYESDECFWEDIVEVDDAEWEEGDVSITCTVCGAILFQCNDHFKEIPPGA